MPRRIALLFSLALAGCAYAPQRPFDPAEQFAFRTASTPYAAAICIARNAKVRPGAYGEERIYGDSGMEVIVHGSTGTLAVARILRDGNYANVTVLVTRHAADDRGGFARGLMTGC